MPDGSKHAPANRRTESIFHIVFCRPNMSEKYCTRVANFFSKAKIDNNNTNAHQHPESTIDELKKNIPKCYTISLVSHRSDMQRTMLIGSVAFSLDNFSSLQNGRTVYNVATATYNPDKANFGECNTIALKLSNGFRRNGIAILLLRLVQMLSAANNTTSTHPSMSLYVSRQLMDKGDDQEWSDDVFWNALGFRVVADGSYPQFQPFLLHNTKDKRALGCLGLVSTAWGEDFLPVALTGYRAHFTGAKADMAKQRAKQIADLMAYQISHR